jgi:hypothetical protein
MAVPSSRASLFVRSLKPSRTTRSVAADPQYLEEGNRLCYVCCNISDNRHFLDRSYEPAAKINRVDRGKELVGHVGVFESPTN